MLHTPENGIGRQQLMATINKICSYRNADENLVMLVHLLYNGSMEKPVIKLLKQNIAKIKRLRPRPQTVTI